MPTSTDLVTDLPADFEVFGQAVDTSLADLKGGTTGQILSKATNANMDFTWVTNDVGDITAVTAGTGITGGGTSGDVTVSFDQANFGGGQWAAGKNKIINGDFGIWQRGTSFDISLGAVYNADRFLTSTTGNTGTTSQQTFTPGTAPVAGYEGQYFARTAVTGVVGASNFTTFGQRIEDVRTFAGQTITISYWAKADAAKSVSLELQQFFGTGGSSSVNTFVVKQALTTSWARYSTTIAVPSVSGKTIGTGATQLDLRYWLSAGSTFDSRTSSLGTQSITFDIWGVQLEAASTASNFQTATGTKQGELAACQRYYIRYAGSATYSKYGIGYAYSTTAAVVQIPNPVTMRVVPTAIEYSTQAISVENFGSIAITALTINGQCQTQPITLTATVASGATQFRPYDLSNNNSASGYVALSAEL